MSKEATRKARLARAKEKRAKLKAIKQEREIIKDKLVEATIEGGDTSEFVDALKALEEAETELTTRRSMWSDNQRIVKLDEHYWIRAVIETTPTPECSGQVFMHYDNTVVMQDSGAFVNVDVARKCLNTVIAAYRTCHKTMQ